MADVGAMVCYVGKELATIWWTAQGLLVGIQDGDVAAVAGQRVEHAGTHRRRYSVRTDSEINIFPKRKTIMLTTSGFIHLKSPINRVCMSNSVFILFPFSHIWSRKVPLVGKHQNT